VTDRALATIINPREGTTLCDDAHAANKMRVQRLYREERLTVRRRGGRKRAMGTRRPIETPSAPNQRWRLDFVSNQLTDCRRSRILAVVDDCTRECLALVADTSLSGRRVARERDAIIHERGCGPDTIGSDNGTEYTSNAILARADETRVGWHYFAPGKPQQNGFIERLASPACGSTVDCATSCSTRRGSVRCRVRERCRKPGDATTTRNGRTRSSDG
jgi:transposase InsO family protein